MTKKKLKKELDKFYTQKLKNPKLKPPKSLEKHLIESNDPELIYQYACMVNKKLNSKLEKILSLDGVYAYLYATQILKDRFKKGEVSILNSFSFQPYMVWLILNRKKSSFLKDYPYLRKYYVFKRKKNFKFCCNLNKEAI